MQISGLSQVATIARCCGTWMLRNQGAVGGDINTLACCLTTSKPDDF